MERTIIDRRGLLKCLEDEAVAEPPQDRQRREREIVGLITLLDARELRVLDGGTIS